MEAEFVEMIENEKINSSARRKLYFITNHNIYQLILPSSADF